MEIKELQGENQFYRALELLAALLAPRTNERFSLVICGGSALVALGLIPRATKDVDVVALAVGERLISATTMPATIIESARLAALELGLPSEWLNSGPASILDESLPNQGFPSGFLDRLTRRDIGPNLSIYLVGRYDQIHFKLYAAADQGGLSQHFADLVNLNPTDEELLAAAAWARLHDPSPGFLDTLRIMLAAMERTHVLARL